MRIDEKINIIDSFERARSFLNEEDDLLNLKWFVISFHHAMHHLMFHALVGSAGEGIWNEGKKKPIKNHNGGIDVLNEKNRLEEFLGTFERIQSLDRMRGYVDSKPFFAEQKHKDAMKCLNDDLRNQFIHYRPISWSIGELDVYITCKPIFEIARFLINESGMCIFVEGETNKINDILNDIEIIIDNRLKQYMQEDIYSQSMELHREHNGKLEIKSKVPVTNKQELSLAYSPGVAEVSRQIAADPAKSFTHTFRGNTVAVVSDGSAILGLGNLGAEAALPVMEGKAILFKEFGGVDAFPICLGTQDTEEIIRAVKWLAPNFAGINLEDISAPRCFEIERRLQEELDIPVMHDDQHGTAVVVLAGLINALKLRGADKAAVRIAVSGAGAAATATVKLLLEYGFRDITACDSKGIICKGREDLNLAKCELAECTNARCAEGSLADAVRGADVFIGMSAPGVLTGEMVRSMNERPIIFALANPVPEIMPDEAKAAGAFVAASGRSDFPNQVNNVLAFPGIFRGALDHGVKRITPRMHIQAAEALAGAVSNPTPEEILPNPFDRSVPGKIAEAIR